MRRKRSGDRWMPIIAIFKLAKAVLLVAAGIGILKLVHHDIGQVIEHWVYVLQLDPDNQHIHNLLMKVWSVDDRRLKEIGAGTFCYAAIFFTEGTGLLLGKRWAQYFTSIVTASFLPLEIYEMIHKPSVVKAGVIAVNVAILIYLIVRLRQKDA
jgi:uncharacterized membrane protein (DUF2068 family)